MKKTVSNVLKHLVCLSLCTVVILPFYMVFINSLKPKAEAARMSLALPTEWHFETYLEVIEGSESGAGVLQFLNICGNFHNNWSVGMCNGGVCYGEK